MTVTMQDVRRWLDPEEPDYDGARAALGPAALPVLQTLAMGGDLALASKATYLASLIPAPETVALLQAAHARGEPVVSVAAAAGIRNLPPNEAVQVFQDLHADPDPGVRKVALRSSVGLTGPAVRARYESMAQTDPEPVIRDLAQKALTGMK